MKCAALVWAALCVSACGPTWNTEYEGDPTENAIEAFESVHGALTVECRQRALDLEIDFVPVTQVRAACEHDSAVGCLYRYDTVRASAYVAEGQGPDVVAHETMHVLMRCARPRDVDGNHNHTDAVWRTSAVRP